MKICPNCQVEVQDHFELCWKCNYGFLEKKVAELQDKRECEIECLRCRVPMYHEGNYDFREGLLVETGKNFDVYVCPRGGKAEFFLPVEEIIKRKFENLNK